MTKIGALAISTHTLILEDCKSKELGGPDIELTGMAVLEKRRSLLLQPIPRQSGNKATIKGLYETVRRKRIRLVAFLELGRTLLRRVNAYSWPLLRLGPMRLCMKPPLQL
jgi:hypothetical protein